MLAEGLNISAQMRRIYVDDTQPDNDIKKISMYSASTGYIAFSKWIGFTTDSGRSFTKKYISSGNVDYNEFNVNLLFGFGVSGVHAFNFDTLVVYGNYGFVPAILYSTDAGNSFKLIYQSQLNSQRLTAGITDMIFPGNGNIGYATEADRIIKSYDGGKSWNIIRDDPNSFFDFLEATDVNNVFAFGESKLLGSNNAGVAWQQITTPGNTINYAYFISPEKGWINMLDDNGVYYTSNGGQTWKLKNNTALNAIRCEKIKFLNDSTGYAIGQLYTSYKTSDSGKTWEPLPRDNQYVYDNWTHTDLYFNSNTQFWAGGGQGFLELTTNGGGAPLPKAFFAIDTTGLSSSKIVNLINYSKTGRLYKWYLNDSLISNAYNANYTHDIYRSGDTITLIVTSGSLADTSVLYQYFIPAPPPPIPAVTSFTPSTASTGTFVTIYGRHFTGATSVEFGQTAAISFTVTSDSTINAVVGQGASGSISVTTPYGTASDDGFTFVLRLAITSFTPTSGPAGSLLTISGSNFSSDPSNDIVYFGTVRAKVVSATVSQINVMVPTGGALEPLSVTVNSLTAYSRLPFLITYIGNDSITSNMWPDKADFPVDIGSIAVAAGDFNGDGKPDLVTANYNALNRLVVLKNNSSLDTAKFIQQPYLTISPGYSGDAVPGLNVFDVDGDGKLDIVTSNDGSTGGFSVFKNTSSSDSIMFSTRVDISSGAASTPSQIVVADFDLDGRPDIVGPADFGIRVFQNLSTPAGISFSMLPASILPGSNIEGMISGQCIATDLDGDGKPDLIVSTVSGIYAFRNTSNAGIISFASPVFYTLKTQLSVIPCIAIGDLDVDGKPDIIIRTQDAIISVVRNTSIVGSISFAPNQDYASPGVITTISIDDMNGDGRPDIVVSQRYSSVAGEDIQAAIWQNKSGSGSISFAPITNLGYEQRAHNSMAVALADFNGDGRSDIAVLNAALSNMSVLLNRSATPVTVCFGSSAQIVSNVTGGSYQWQQKIKDTFANISDNASFSGTNTATLQLINPPQSWNGYQYRCKVDGGYSKSFSLLVKMNDTPSVTISLVDTTICIGGEAMFVASPVNGGASPGYQWQINGIRSGSNSDTFTVSSLNNGDNVSAVLTSNASCLSSTKASSNVIKINGDSLVSVSVSIFSKDSVVCAGDSATFVASSLNGGASPFYQWQINGVNSGANASVFTTAALKNGDVIGVVLSSNAACTLVRQVTSNLIKEVVRPSVIPSVSINASATAICVGDTAAFAALPVYGGSLPVFQWQVNGVNVVGNDSIFISSSLKDGDKVNVIMTSNMTCLSGGAVSGSGIKMSVSPEVVPGVMISASSSDICEGTPVNFIATPQNGGTKPSYQWYKNGDNTGSDSAIYNDVSLKNKDVITVILNSNASCTQGRAAESNAIEMTVNKVVKLSGEINGLTNVDSGQTVLLTLNVADTSGALNFQWQDSTSKSVWGNIANATGKTLYYMPAKTGNGVRCIVTGDAPCTSPASDTTNTLLFIVKSASVSQPVDSGVTVKFFPNPVNSVLNISDLKLNDQWQAIVITDLMGKHRVIDADLHNSTSITVNVANLPKGVYVAVLTRQSGPPVYFKFLKI